MQKVSVPAISSFSSLEAAVDSRVGLCHLPNLTPAELLLHTRMERVRSGLCKWAGRAKPALLLACLHCTYCMPASPFIPVRSSHSARRRSGVWCSMSSATALEDLIAGVGWDSVCKTLQSWFNGNGQCSSGWALVSTVCRFRQICKGDIALPWPVLFIPSLIYIWSWLWASSKK